MELTLLRRGGHVGDSLWKTAALALEDVLWSSGALGDLAGDEYRVTLERVPLTHESVSLPV